MTTYVGQASFSIGIDVVFYNNRQNQHTITIVVSFELFTWIPLGIKKEKILFREEMLEIYSAILGIYTLILSHYV